MTSQDDQTTSSFDSTSPAGEEPAATSGLAAQTGAQAQTPSAVDGSDGDLGSAPTDGVTGEPSDPAGASDGGPGVDDSDSGRGNLDGSTAQEDVRAASLSQAQDSLDYTDSAEAGADNGSME